jgi:hypothetical protein
MNFFSSDRILHNLARMLLLLLPVLQVPLASAHLQPTTLAEMDVGAGSVAMTLRIPLSELELAFGHNVTHNPQQTLPLWEARFREYLIQHIRSTTSAGQPWTVQVLHMNVESAVQTQSGPFQEVTVQVALTPPSSASVRDFILHYDVIMHQVVTHKVLVSIRSDWAGGSLEPVQVGRIAVDTGAGTIAPLAIHLGSGSSWAGFKAMVSLGMQHIREGSDHLLFILVLLLPATLTWKAGRWANYGGGRYSFVRLLRVVTAFTFGHSITLLAGTLHWLQLPPQPVEVMIAFSILVTAVHAMRPIFPGREQQVAAAFGLIHGLAFAAVLAELHLSAGPLALSVLGFNLGIEMMQLFVISLTIPWFILLSHTAAHQWVRCGGAVFAAIASVGWIVNRISGHSNIIERGMNSVTTLAPLGILILALVAIPAYSYTLLRPSSAGLEERA